MGNRDWRGFCVGIVSQEDVTAHLTEIPFFSPGRFPYQYYVCSGESFVYFLTEYSKDYPLLNS